MRFKIEIGVLPVIGIITLAGCYYFDANIMVFLFGVIVGAVFSSSLEEEKTMFTRKGLRDIGLGDLNNLGSNGYYGQYYAQRAAYRHSEEKLKEFEEKRRRERIENQL